MPPAHGSDSERLMAQIEAFLRTGEAPPAAPEPETGAPPPLRETGHCELDRLDPSDPALVGHLPASSAVDRLRRRLSGPRNRTWIDARLERLRAWSEPVWADRGRGGPGPGTGQGPRRRWTPTQTVVIAGAMVLLLLIPYVLARHTTGNPDGPDRASARPAGPGYAFLRVNPTGTPVRWNPCSPIYYQLDLAAAPAGAQADVARAIEEISTATGIVFVYSGQTNQFPLGTFAPGPASAVSPVVIAWASGAQSQAAHLAVSLDEAKGAFPGPTAALGRSVPVLAKDRSTGRMAYVSGSVVISRAAADLPAGFGSGGEGVLLLHELGRLVGLTEVTDGAQVMDPDVEGNGVTGLGAGDRAGLARLGKGSGCLSVPANSSLFAAF